MKTRILVVDDEQAFLDSMMRMLRMEGYPDITAVPRPTEAIALLDGEPFDVAFLDITMPEMDGLELLGIIKERSPETECVMVTANESIPMVITAVRRGAYDYLVKPIVPEQVTHVLDRALERKRLMESLMLRSTKGISKSLDNPDAFSEIVTADKGMMRLLHEAELHAASNIPVLVTGETGAGKELMARAIHRASRRASGPFVAVNMLSLSPTLFESEFFGHVKGAFTGADRDKAGYMAKASGGTLFLDEIGDLSMDIQGKLLRILQEGEYTPVGQTRPQTADVRFVAATNQDLEKLVQARQFRKDLFYRLQFAQLEIPPLRERRDDIRLLADRFKADGVSLSQEATDALAAHSWPGNVRELKGAVEAASNLAETGSISPEHLRLPAEAKRAAVAPGPQDRPAVPSGPTMEPLAEVERRHILAVYEASGRNKSQSARILQIGLQTLHRKLKAYGVK